MNDDPINLSWLTSEWNEKNVSFSESETNHEEYRGFEWAILLRRQWEVDYGRCDHITGLVRLLVFRIANV